MWPSFGGRAWRDVARIGVKAIDAIRSTTTMNVRLVLRLPMADLLELEHVGVKVQ